MTIETEADTVNNTPEFQSNPKDSREVYVVIAYRYGMRDNHSYLVTVSATPEEAIDAADKEVSWRGGKYGCEVRVCTLGVWHECGRGGAQIYYAESPYEGVLGAGVDQVDVTNPGWRERMIDNIRCRYPDQTEYNTDDTDG